ncbi:autotransporter outer membrane beta-barrel domain-containing protein [Enterobacteriaceae bacterium 4M9]|nr:autotransporter outer membrane beta-barrel domain-containing protein [Enterobacteriaceae bacterium 4M9]
MKPIFYRTLLPALYLSAYPLSAAEIMPAPYSPLKTANIPENLLTNADFTNHWEWVEQKWLAGYPSLTIEKQKYLANLEITLLNPAFSKQVVTLLDNSYSLNNTLNSVQLSIGSSLYDAGNSEAVNTVVKGEYLNSKGNIETGVLQVYTGGTAHHTTVEENGALTLNGSGEAYDTLVKTGGIQTLGSKSYAQANVIDGGTQQLNVGSTAVAEDTLVYNKGQQIIYGGTAKNSHIGADSYQLASGLAMNTYLYNGAFQQVYAGKGEGYVADTDTTIYAGARQTVTYGVSENAQVYGTQVITGVDGSWSDGDWTSDSTSKVRVNGQQSTGATVYAGGLQRIQTGNADGAQIYGTQLVSGQKGGWVSGLWVDQDGYTGGTRANATNTTVLAGGLQQLAWYGEATNTIVDGGTQQVDALGHITDTTIQNGGASYIDFGGYSSGFLNVQDGSLTMKAGDEHDWTGNLGKGAWAAAVDLQGPSSTLFIKQNSDASESVVTIKALTNNGNVSFGAADGSDEGRYSRLELATLEGSGTFYMNTNLSGNEGDFLSVSESVSGNFNVTVRDSGQELRTTSASPYHLIYASGSAADTFAMSNGSVDLGAYKYYLVHGEDTDKDNWYLSPQANTTEPGPDPEPTPEPKPEPTPEPEPEPTPEPKPEPTPEPKPEPTPEPEPEPTPEPEPEPTPEPKPEPTPEPKPELSESAKAAIIMANVTPTIWDAELSTLRTRLGDVRKNGESENAAWGKYISSRYRMSTEHVGYRQDTSGVILGGDKRLALSNSTLLLGAMASFTRSDINSSSANGKVDSYGLGLYATWLHNNGYYIDSVIKANRFRTENSPRFNASRTNAKDNTVGGGFSLEAGRYMAFGSWFVEPYVQSALFIGDKTQYQFDSGMTVKADATQSLKGEAGLTFGKNITLLSGAMLQPYMRLAVRHEFMKNNALVINQTEHFSNDMSGTSGKYGLGMTAKLNDSWSAWGEVSYEKGQHIEMPYSGHLGLRLSF